MYVPVHDVEITVLSVRPVRLLDMPKNGRCQHLTTGVRTIRGLSGLKRDEFLLTGQASNVIYTTLPYTVFSGDALYHG